MEKSLTTSWLAARLGADPIRLDAMRRGGQLLAYREPGSQEYRFPAWQFDESLRPLPIVPRLVAAARESGIADERLLELMGSRLGMGGADRLLDLVRAGDDETVVAAIRAAK